MAPVRSTFPLTRFTRRECNAGRRAVPVPGTPPQSGNTATVAVKPCRKLRPPTGPISPAAKKPAVGRPAQLTVDQPGVVVGDAEHAPAAAVAGEDEGAGGGTTRQRIDPYTELAPQILVGRAGIAGVQSHDLTGTDARADGDPSGVAIGAEQATDEEVALLVVGLAALDHDAHEQAPGDQRALVRGELADDGLDRLQGRSPGELVDHVARQPR